MVWNGFGWVWALSSTGALFIFSFLLITSIAKRRKEDFRVLRWLVATSDHALGFQVIAYCYRLDQGPGMGLALVLVFISTLIWAYWHRERSFPEMLGCEYRG